MKKKTARGRGNKFLKYDIILFMPRRALSFCFDIKRLDDKHDLASTTHLPPDIYGRAESKHFSRGNMFINTLFKRFAI